MELTIRPVDRSSAAYHEFVRLHRIACDMRPGHRSRWNGELYTFDGDPWGGYDPETGRMLLSRQLVLDHLTDSTANPLGDAQAEALATVLHESYHATAEYESDDPNAVYSRATVVLNEGLVERSTLNNFRIFAKRAGYPGLSLETNQYEGAVAAVDHLLTYAAGPDHADALVRSALARPVPLHWDTIAGAIVQARLPDVPVHERSIRAALVGTLTRAPWDDLPTRSRHVGEQVGRTTELAVEAALDRITAAHAAFDGIAPPATKAADQPKDNRPHASSRKERNRTPGIDLR
jgi:hypothetical protein